MALKTILTAQEYEQLPEALQKEYEKQADGSFVLQYDGRDKLDEFRSNNRKLFGQVEELQGQLRELQGRVKDVDPDEFRRLKDDERKRKDQKLIEEGKLEELLEERTQRMRQSYDEKVQDLTGRVETTTQLLDKVVVENKIRAAAQAARPKNERAVLHIINALRSQFRRDGETAIRIGADGKPIMGKDGTQPETIEDAVTELRKTDPFLFEESRGGGASGGEGGSNGKPVKVIPRDPQIMGLHAEGLADGSVVVEPAGA